MEERASDFHLSSYGVSNTSLEEVFLELAEEDDDKDLNDASHEHTASTLTEPKKQVIMDDLKYLGGLSQIFLLMHKRLLIQRRDLKGLFIKILLPVILVCLVLFTLLFKIKIEGTPIELSTELYNTSGECNY